jgi:pyruvate kinase
VPNSNKEFRLTKIIATLGPASEALETIVQLIEAGVSIFRINFSHGTFEEYDRLLNTVRRASQQTGLPIAVLGDLSGPKIRVGEVVPNGIYLEDDRLVQFKKQPVVAGSPSTVEADRMVFSTNYPRFIEEVQPGQRVLLDDGNVHLQCIEQGGQEEHQTLTCKVVHGGLITSNKGINLPDTDLSVPALTRRDYQCADFAVEKGFDFLALSFVRSADDVRQLKDHLREHYTRETKIGTVISKKFIPVISKIEKPQAMGDIEAIVRETDGIMVARGDLGVEMDLAEVPVLQKRIVSLCHQFGKPVIVATQMLQSMINAPSPTRAEVSDVANAIFDGVDAVMLSGETAVGKWPVQAVTIMSRIEQLTNDYVQEQTSEVKPLPELHGSNYSTPALAQGVNVIMRGIKAKLVAVWSATGRGPLHLSQNRLPRPIVAFSDNPEALRRMTLMYGLKPVCMPKPVNTAEFIAQVDRKVQEEGWAGKGDPIIIVSGEPIGQVGRTNSVSIHYIGDVSGI